MSVTRTCAQTVLRTLAIAVLVLGFSYARAAPWAEVGDAQLRSDIETLAAAGVIDNLTTEWPVPWTRILDRLSVSGSLTGQPAWVVDAAQRIRLKAAGQMAQDTSTFSAYFDATNAPAVVRGFDALGRENVQTQATLSWNGDTTFIQLSAGAQSHDHFDAQSVVLDGTYIAKQIDGAAVYAGYLTHWWGPGWISALSLSNNARPVPQIGISRLDTSPFKTKWLSWLGPWQAEFFVGGAGR
ncbi:MAG: capsule assembly Wzi family protein [Steroidobacteraceae bacterium]